ncbi:MAG: hypothetical protein JWP91_4283 [Fibrobacteres bacterium]|nr:hypothetical protein [Fibrobacterota bacterium]
MMKPFPDRAAVPTPSFRLVAGAFLSTALLTSQLASCSGTREDPAARVQAEWRLIPEATVLNEKRQFFLYGRRLDSVTVTIPPSVTMEKGDLNNGGRVLSLHFRVAPLAKDSLAAGESVGNREVRVKTPDTSLVFTIKVVDEALPR